MIFVALFMTGTLCFTYGYFKGKDDIILKYYDVCKYAEDVTTANCISKCPKHIYYRIQDLKKALNELNK